MPFYSTNNRIVATLQYIILWVSLFIMTALFLFLFQADLKIPQKSLVQKIDITNKVNICLPEDEKELQKDSLL